MLLLCIIFACGVGAVVVLVLLFSAMIRRAVGKPPPGGNPIDRSPTIRWSEGHGSTDESSSPEDQPKR